MFDNNSKSFHKVNILFLFQVMSSLSNFILQDITNIVFFKLKILLTYNNLSIL